MTLKRRIGIESRYAACPIDCPIYVATEIKSLSDFFAVFSSLLHPDHIFWFRGHSKLEYRLMPSALRYPTVKQREDALGLVIEMRRFLEMKLPAPPGPTEHLAWTQIAQHYGLPTRLLDWTQNAAVALFFACSSHPDDDGLVVIINPLELNEVAAPGSSRIFTIARDQDLIDSYLRLKGATVIRGKRTIAINPTWNNDRIAIQQGAFTLHGSRQFELDKKQASSLVYVPILREHKDIILNELHRVGIGEMFIFPEPEHVCSHLRRVAKL